MGSISTQLLNILSGAEIGYGCDTGTLTGERGRNGYDNGCEAYRKRHDN